MNIDKAIHLQGQLIQQMIEEQQAKSLADMAKARGLSLADSVDRSNEKVNKNFYTPLRLAILFHDTYERLAPEFGYETREETRQFDADTPNGKLMIAVCEEILRKLD